MSEASENQCVPAASARLEAATPQRKWGLRMTTSSFRGVNAYFQIPSL
jgi:hypothetical protein